MTGPLKAISVVVRRSSAIPEAYLLIRLAVAGTTVKISQLFASSI